MNHYVKTMLFAGISFIAVSGLNAEMLYQFTFSGQDDATRLTSSGKLKETAKVCEIDGQKIEFVQDAPIKDQAACKFTLTPQANRGAMLVIPESVKQLLCTKVRDKMTIAMWVKWDGTTREASGLASKSNQNQTSGWMFRIMKDGKLSFASCGGYGARNSVSPVETNKWTHVAVTWDVGNAKGVVMYINGVNAGINLDYVGNNGCKESAETIRIGVQTSGQYLPLNGSVCDVRFYDEVLTEDAIMQIVKTAAPTTEK